MIEITQAEWIYEPSGRYFSVTGMRSALKEIWMNFFHFLAAISYRVADPIVSLYEGNRNLQIEFGAPPEKLRVVPNGVHPHEFDEARRLRQEARAADPQRCVVGFIGRIVPIKDVKTLIRAAKFVNASMPHVVFRLFGPTEEDEGYFRECVDLAAILDVEQIIHFEGSRTIRDIFPLIDIMILTSISEAQPLVILEAFASETPVVSTDVGSCRELINGRDGDDKRLGVGGFLTATSSPAEIADALQNLCKNRPLQDKMGAIGRQRVERFYDQKKIVDWYRSLYDGHSPAEL